MTAKEMKIKVFSLIEEYYPEQTLLADDQDVQYKINGAINQIQMDLMKYRKIPFKYKTTIKKNNPVLLFNSIPNFYQINTIPNIDYEIVGDYEIKFDIDEDTEVEIYYYKYPEMMDLTFEASGEKTKEQVSAEYDESFEFELSMDPQEIMPYGIAADLLKNDMISGYGKYFYERYLEMKNMIDSRKTSGTITVTGGVDI